MGLISTLKSAPSPLSQYLNINGQFPPISLQITPIDPSRSPITLTTFTEYSFTNSVIVPIDSFNFSMRNPSDNGSLLDFVRDGDIATLMANGSPISTGIIDSVTIMTSAEAGEEVHISGRNLLSQLEDQSAVNDKALQIYSKVFTPAQVINTLITNTRINYYRLQDNPDIPKLPIFTTVPGESKLASLIRYLEPINMIVWMDPDGTVVLGKPDMGSDPDGAFVMDKKNRYSNCLSIQANYSSTRIPNIIIPVWTGSEGVQALLPEQALANAAQNPRRLLTQGHRVPKCITVSTPNGSDEQAIAQSNQFAQVGGSNVLQAYAKREMARANVGELGVQVNIQGHYNSNLQPILCDATYQISYPRAGIDRNMYLHTVTYSLSVQSGQKTSLFFCNLGCIVADTSTVSEKLSSVKIQVNP